MTDEEIEPTQCNYKNKIIKLKTDSLDNEIIKSELIKNKLANSKYITNFSYIEKSENIKLSEIESEITTCNLPKNTNYEYILCSYTNTTQNQKNIMDYLNEKAKIVDVKIIVRIITDFHITLHEALEELYNQTKIVHHLINPTNIIISEENIPIIQNFKEAKIMEPDEKIKDTNETPQSYDTYVLIQTFLNIIQNINIEDETHTLEKYQNILNSMLEGERSIKNITNI